ncbi:MAG: enoyl-CoA hydratase/isomerase family protein, partial [archaeon]
TYMLPKLVGETTALDLMMTGRRITSEEAKQIGLVTEVYPVEKFESRVSDFVNSLLSGPPISMRAMKRLIRDDTNLKDSLKEEAKAFGYLWNYDDLKEGIAAFNERRKPDFKGA